MGEVPSQGIVQRMHEKPKQPNIYSNIRSDGIVVTRFRAGCL